MKMRRLFGCALLVAAVGCSSAEDGVSRDPASPDPDPTPDQALTAGEASALFNEGVLLALKGAPGVTVSRANDTVLLDGVLVLATGDVTFDELALATQPFSPAGSATVSSEGHDAALVFTGSVTGTIAIDGAAAGSVMAEFPMTAEFAEGAADWAMHVALNPGQSFADPCPNLTFTDNGNGSFTIDGDCTVGGATVDFDMVTIDVVNMAITGKITLDDGNNNTALIEFNGDTFDVTVNGNLVVDDEPIFAFLGP